MIWGQDRGGDRGQNNNKSTWQDTQEEINNGNTDRNNKRQGQGKQDVTGS